MTQLKHPFAVRFKHHWNPDPVWETFWAQTAEQAIEQAKQSYIAIGELVSTVEIIKVVPLQPDQAIMPSEVRKYNEAQEKRAARLQSDSLVENGPGQSVYFAPNVE